MWWPQVGPTCSRHFPRPHREPLLLPRCLISESMLWFRMTRKQMSRARVPRGRNVTGRPHKSTSFESRDRWHRVSMARTPGNHGHAYKRESVRFCLDNGKTQICIVHLPGPWRRELRQLLPVKRGEHLPSRSLTALYGKCRHSKPSSADSTSLFPPVQRTVTGRNLSEPESTLAITLSFPTSARREPGTRETGGAQGHTPGEAQCRDPLALSSVVLLASLYTNNLKTAVKKKRLGENERLQGRHVVTQESGCD